MPEVLLSDPSFCEVVVVVVVVGVVVVVVGVVVVGVVVVGVVVHESILTLKEADSFSPVYPLTADI